MFSRFNISEILDKKKFTTYKLGHRRQILFITFIIILFSHFIL